TSKKSVGKLVGASANLTSAAVAASTVSTSGTVRYCDFHQRLYPGLNLHQSRTKLLQTGKSLNTQKPASTTKFMHKRYQNGGRSSPIADLLSTTEQEDLASASRHCPDCAARNNHGTST